LRPVVSTTQPPLFLIGSAVRRPHPPRKQTRYEKSGLDQVCTRTPLIRLPRKVGCCAFGEVLDLRQHLLIPHCLGRAGSGRRRKRELDRAIQDYDQAIALEPNYASAFLSRGAAYYGKRELDRAIRDFDQAIGLDPNNALAFDSRGRAYGDAGEYDRAIQDFDQAIKLDPNNAPAFGNRCLARATLNRLQKAVVDCNEALRLRPGDDALRIRGLVYLKLKKLDLALTDYDDFLDHSVGEVVLLGVAAQQICSSWSLLQETMRRCGDSEGKLGHLRFTSSLSNSSIILGVSFSQMSVYDRSGRRVTSCKQRSMMASCSGGNGCVVIY
jgi:tetratricopeptide (TPR) repeat protein